MAIAGSDPNGWWRTSPPWHRMRIRLGPTAGWCVGGRLMPSLRARRPPSAVLFRTDDTGYTGTGRRPGGAANRLDRRKARTRAALIEAAQALLAEGRTNAPVNVITEAADLGIGSFYNHFDTKEQPAVTDALERHADYLEELTRGWTTRPRCSPRATASPAASTGSSRC